MRCLVLFIASTLGLATLQAQHTDYAILPESDRASWRVALLIGHTVIPAGHTTERAIIPSWGLDIEYWPSAHWGIGWHNDLEIESFLVESNQRGAVERQYPLVSTLDVLWKPWKGLVLQLGPGVELERKDNLWLVRWGLEYEFHLDHQWDLAPSFFYDTRHAAYDTWTLALGVGKRF